MMQFTRPLRNQAAGIARARFSTRTRLGYAAQPPVSPPNATASVPKPKKRHRVRNFVVVSTLLVLGGYGAGVYYSLKDDNFYDRFTLLVPFSGIVVDTVDNWVFDMKVRGRINPERAGTQSPEAQDPNQFMKVEGDNKANAHLFKEKASASPVVVGKKPDTSANKAVKDSQSSSKPSVSAAQLSPAVPVKKGSAKAEDPAHPEQPQGVSVPLIDGGAKASAPSVKAGGKIPSADTTQISPAAIDPLLRDLSETINYELRAHDFGLDQAPFAAKVAKKLREASDNIQARLSTITAQHNRDLKTREEHVQEQADEAYLAEKLNLVESYNRRLQSALNAVTAKAVAAANNRIEAQYIALQEQFEREVNDRVEAERDGRLSQIAELTRDVNTLQEAMLSSGRILESEDGVVSFYVALGNLQRVLGSTDTIPLGPYVAALTKALPSDPLVSAVANAVPATAKQYGVLSHTQLAARFSHIEPEIRQASLVPPDAGILGHAASAVVSHALVKKEGLPEGNDVESVIARAQTYLQQGDVLNAVAEVNSLQGWPKKIASDWLSEGRKRGEIEFLVSVLADEGRLWSISRNN